MNQNQRDLRTPKLGEICGESRQCVVINISRYFHCRVWITSDVSIHLTSLNVPHFRNSNAYNSVIYERKHKVRVFIFLVRTLGTVNVVPKLFVFSKNFCFLHFHRLLCE